MVVTFSQFNERSKGEDVVHLLFYSLRRGRKVEDMVHLLFCSLRTGQKVVRMWFTYFFTVL